MKHAVVLFSGGMDSTIALYWALNDKDFSSVDALTIDYGQSNINEIDCAYLICESITTNKLVQVRVLRIPPMLFSGDSYILGRSQITEYASVDETMQDKERKDYIPARNAIFLSFAANHLLARSPAGGAIVTGFRGFSKRPLRGFADGSKEFGDAMADALSIGSVGYPHDDDDRHIQILSPLCGGDRSRLSSLVIAKSLPGCWDALAFSMSCFKGETPPCGKCLPCVRRAAAFKAFGSPDPLLELYKK